MEDWLMEGCDNGDSNSSLPFVSPPTIPKEDPAEIVARDPGFTTDDFLSVLAVFNGFEGSSSSGEMFFPA